MILIVLTYLAGVLTILSPCILPVLPFVFASSQKSFLKNGVPLLAGMGLTFSLFSALAVVGGEWIAQVNQFGRILAMLLLSLFALSLIFPQISEKLVEPLTKAGAKIGNVSGEESLWKSFLIGISTGLLWAPCAGPILGLVLTGAAVQGNVGSSIALLLSYSLGAATSLALALVAGNKFFGTLKKFLGVDQVIKKILGVAVLLGVLAIALNWDRTVLTQISKFETASFENKLLSWAGLEKKPEAKEATGQGGQIEGEMPELSGAVAWLNSPPLTKESLKGKVVLIDFWTYSCINCLRTLPYVKSWAEKYKDDGLVVIGVHTPEFAFEKNEANVQNALKELGVTYPVAVDSDYKIWNAFNNQYWPAHYFVDRQGHIRHHHFGEGEYAESEKIIQELLLEAGGTLHAETKEMAEAKGMRAQGVQAAASANDIISPETYLGSDRAQNFVASSRTLKTNEWSLVGKWTIEKEKIILNKPHGKILYRFHARDVHLVLGSEQKTKIKFKVSIDGNAPGEEHGVDVDKDGFGEVQEQRLYQLIRQKEDKTLLDHTFEIEFFDSGVEAYAFTFG